MKRIDQPILSFMTFSQEINTENPFAYSDNVNSLAKEKVIQKHRNYSRTRGQGSYDGREIEFSLREKNTFLKERKGFLSSLLRHFGHKKETMFRLDKLVFEPSVNEEHDHQDGDLSLSQAKKIRFFSYGRSLKGD